MKKIITLLFVVFSVTIFSQNRFDKIDKYLNFLYENNKFMGSLCIREGNTTVFSKAYGFADVAKKIPATQNTKYKIGSITKTFTSVMIWQLIDEKKLKLNTPLASFYPKIAQADSITISHLLYQRSGIRDYINSDSLTTKELSKKDLKTVIYNKIEQYVPLFSPGSKYEYSNSNYFLLGGILEQVTKKTFQENLSKRIVKKAKLLNTYYTENSISTENKESYSYLFNGEQWTVFPETKNEIAYAAGGIFSTAEDVTLFFEALFNGKLLKKESLNKMKTLQQSYGAALFTMPFGNRKFYGHTGGIEGFRTVMGYNETEKMGVSLFVNGDNYNRNDIMIGILSMYYKVPFPFPSFEKIDAEIITKYSGNYTSTELPLAIKVFGKEGVLMAQATGQQAFELTMKNKTTFVFPPAGIEMVFTETTLVLKQGGMEFNYTKKMKE